MATFRRPSPGMTRRTLLALAAGLPLLPLAAWGRENPGDWLIGVWLSPYSPQQFEFRRAGDKIVWTYTRSAFKSTNPKWGEKPPARGSGQVIRLTDDEIELDGVYEWSESRSHARKLMKFWFKRMPSGMLAGTGLGAGKEYFDLSLRRAD
ncbi:MAG: hypothetical protein HY057_03635 [Rhodospirillales bacterium]|nr:hypothetical protein [Rhodospirillales bacterium]